MKAIMITNRMKKMLLSIGILTLITSTSFGQGILLESISFALKSKKTEKVDNGPFANAVFTDSGKTDTKTYSLNKRNTWNKSERKVIKSFTVSSFDLVAEEQLETENWMGAPFSESFESTLTVEEWMTTPLNESLESDIYLEDWMAEPFSTQLEETIKLEEWMTTPLI